MAKDKFELKEIDTLLTAISGVDNRIEELVTELKAVVEGQLKVIKSLKDENESLWFMLEEIQESDKAAKKVMDEQKILEMLSEKKTG